MEKQNEPNPAVQDKICETPEIIEHGSVEALTQNGGAGSVDALLGSQPEQP